RPCLRPLLLARVSVRAADPGSEEPAALQLRQGGGLSIARTTNRRAHQHSAHPRPLAGNPAGCRLDPYGHRGRLPDLAAARLLPAAKRPRCGAARAEFKMDPISARGSAAAITMISLSFLTTWGQSG